MQPASYSRRPLVWLRAVGPQLDAGLNLRMFGRSLVNAIVIGIAAGLACIAFSKLLDYLQSFLLGTLAGFEPLRVARRMGYEAAAATQTPNLVILLLLPIAGALVTGWLATRYAPEVLGGGGDAAIESYHRYMGVVRRRVPFVKALASMLTLGAGGVGGREGPTLQIGSGVASAVSRLLGLGPHERRVLYLAGMAAGVSAVFQAPLGAALFAVEVVYRDDFEADALIPAVLASVMSYATVTPFTISPHLLPQQVGYHYDFADLPAFAVLGIAEAGLALGFVRLLVAMRHTTLNLPIVPMLRPAFGALLLSLICTPLLVLLARATGQPGGAFGILGGGYGAAELAVAGASWLPLSWYAVAVLLAVCALKLVGSVFTIGSGGSAGDLAPSLAVGGLFGAAFGHAYALLTHDAAVDPSTFALVGMAAMFGSIAHVPLAALVLVCELAGSFELTVPLMLAEAVAVVIVGNRTLYGAQRNDRNDRRIPHVQVEPRLRVRHFTTTTTDFHHFHTTTTAEEVTRTALANPQEMFPVIDPRRDRLAGLISRRAILRFVDSDRISNWMTAADLMLEPVHVRLDDSVLDALYLMRTLHIPMLPVVDPRGHIVGWVSESETRARFAAASPAASAVSTASAGGITEHGTRTPTNEFGEMIAHHEGV